MEQWAKERFKAVVNRGVEQGIWLVLVAVALAAWKWGSGDVTLPFWLLVLLVGVPLVLAVMARRRGRRPAPEAAMRIAELETDNALYGYYASMLSDVLRTIQQKIRGDLEGVGIDALIEQGIRRESSSARRPARTSGCRLRPRPEGILIGLAEQIG